MSFDQKLLSPFWWLWVPALGMAVQIAMEIFLSADTLSAMHSEKGLHEWLQFLVITAAFLVACRALVTISWKKQPWLSIWFFLAALCCLYVSGEEISWGQKIWNWATPEYWAHVNDQQETNLHNTSFWFDQKPRQALELGIVVGGLLIPLLKKMKPDWYPSRFESIYPPRELVVLSLFVVIPHLAEKIFESLGIVIFERFSEVQELYMFAFVLLYLIVLHRREIAK